MNCTICLYIVNVLCMAAIREDLGKREREQRRGEDAVAKQCEHHKGLNLWARKNADMSWRLAQPRSYSCHRRRPELVRFLSAVYSSGENSLRTHTDRAMLATSIQAIDGHGGHNGHNGHSGQRPSTFPFQEAKVMQRPDTVSAMEIPRTTSPIQFTAHALSPRSFGMLEMDAAGTGYGQSIESVMQASELSCEVSEQSLSLSVESDYLPKLEHDFCRNFTCCGVYLDNLHQLQSHYETEHAEDKEKEKERERERETSTRSSSSGGSSSSGFSNGNTNTTKSMSTAATSSHSGASRHSCSLPGTPMLDMEVDDAPPSSPFPRSFSAGMNCITPNMPHPAALARSHNVHNTQPSQQRAVPVSMSTPMYPSMSGYYAQQQMQQMQQMQQQRHGVQGIQQPRSATQFAPLQPHPHPHSQAHSQPAYHTAMAAAAAAAAASTTGLSGMHSTQPLQQQHQQHQQHQPHPYIPTHPLTDVNRDKPYKCPVPVGVIALDFHLTDSDAFQGCNKAYKQQNGLKYHRSKGQCSFQQAQHT